MGIENKGFTSQEYGILYSSEPFVGGKRVIRFFVAHGGFKLIPGTKEAIKSGCCCPGRVGERDHLGVVGYTVDKFCPIHGYKNDK